MSEKLRFRTGPLALIVACLVFALVSFLWGKPATLDPSAEVRIGTATKGGTYAKFGSALEPFLKKGLGGPEVKVIPTKGSHDNVERLEKNKLDLALIQNDVRWNDHVQIVAPLYKEYLHIIVNTDRIPDAASIKDLEGKRVALGPIGSGSRVAVEVVLRSFSVEVKKKNYASVSHEHEALINDEIDAIFRVAGLPDQIVTDLLKRKGMALLPVAQKKELEDFHKKYTSYKLDYIPEGKYGTVNDPSPKAATVSVIALLVARSNLPSKLVRRITEVFNKNQIKIRENSSVEKPSQGELKPYMKNKFYEFDYHRGARAYYKWAFDWYRRIPLMAAVFFLVFGLAIALREVFRMRHLGYAGTGDQDITPHDVFLCHSSTGDQSSLHRICTALEKEGICCWYAPRNIPAGRNWPDLIPTAINQTEVAMVLMFTKHANESEQISSELTLARSAKLKIIPYLLENTQPTGAIKYHIANVQWIEAYAQPHKKSLAELIEAVNRIRNKKLTPIQSSAYSPTSDSIKAPATGPAPELTPTPPEPDLLATPSRRSIRWLPWVSGLSVVLIGAAFVLWYTSDKTDIDGMAPTVSKEKPGDYVLGRLIYEWDFLDRDEPGVKYVVERSSGGATERTGNIQETNFEETKLSGHISWKVRALVPNSNGGMTSTPWSDSLHVERYKDTLDKILHKKRVVVVTANWNPDQEQELELIRSALQGYTGEQIKVVPVKRSFKKFSTLFSGEEKDEYDLMAASISVRKTREQDWKVKFTDTIRTYPQVIVRLKDSHNCIKPGSTRPCKIAVIEGTVNQDLANEIKVGNPTMKVVPIPDRNKPYVKILEMLKNGEVDILLIDEPFAHQLKNKQEKQEEEASLELEVDSVDQVLDDPREWEKIAIATKRKDNRLRDVLNAAIKEHREKNSRVRPEYKVTLETPEDGKNVLGELIYRWYPVSSGKQNVVYQIEREMGDSQTPPLRKITPRLAFPEDKLSGEIRWRVRMYDETKEHKWSARRTVKYYQDSWSRILKTGIVTIGVGKADGLFIDEHELGGPSIELLSKYFNYLLAANNRSGGVQFKSSHKTWGHDYLLMLSEYNNVDLLASRISITDEREKNKDYQIRFTRPIIHYPQSIIALDDTTVFEDGHLAISRLGAQADSTNQELAGKLLKQLNPHYQEADIERTSCTSKQCLMLWYGDFGYIKEIKAVESGNIDGIVADKPYAHYLLRYANGGLKVVDVTQDKVAGIDIGCEAIGFATRNKDTKLREQLDKAIEANPQFRTEFAQLVAAEIGIDAEDLSRGCQPGQ